MNLTNKVYVLLVQGSKNTMDALKMDRYLMATKSSRREELLNSMQSANLAIASLHQSALYCCKALKWHVCLINQIQSLLKMAIESSVVRQLKCKIKLHQNLVVSLKHNQNEERI